MDILITGSLFFLLKTSRTNNLKYVEILIVIHTFSLMAFSSLNAVIDTLILYAFEMGALTTCVFV